MGNIMKIIELRAQNFARLTAVTIRPDGRLVQITGANGEGKTSTLRAIWATLKGKAEAPPVMVREGAEQCRLQVTLGDGGKARVIVTRIFEGDDDDGFTTSLNVVADGKKITTKPQAYVDALVGEFCIDPLAFSKLSDKDRFDKIKGLVPGFDFEANAAARKEAFEERTDVNRVADREGKAALAIVLPPGPAPRVEDVGALNEKLAEALQHNTEVSTRERRREQAAEAIEAKRDEAEQLRQRSVTLDREADELQMKLDAAEALPARIDVAQLQAAITRASANMGAADLHRRKAEHERLAEEAAKESAELTAEIERLDADKAEAIGAAKLPVEGLTLGDGAVLMDGLPFSQAATSKRIKASAAIAMALAKDLRVLTIDEGSELDSASIAMLMKMAEERDFDVWMARVDESGQVGFTIVDGSVAAINGEPTS